MTQINRKTTPAIRDKMYRKDTQCISKIGKSAVNNCFGLNNITTVISVYFI